MQILEIAENDAGQRLDKFLRKLFPQATRALLYKLNRTWKIKISEDGQNFKKQDNEYKLKQWEKVKLFMSEKDFSELSKRETSSVERTITDNFTKEDIVYEDGFLLVVNKSAWVNVHPWDHKTKEVSLIEKVHDYLWWKLDSLTFKPSLVHRIDRDTSGIVLIAKKKDILSKLVDDLKEHKKVRKIYYAIALGKLKQKDWVIDVKLERIENATHQNKVQVSKNGQKAITKYTCLEEKTVTLDGKSHIISLLEVEIETWRMHQIRVHLASIWNPILWDDTYGDKWLNYLFKKHFLVTRQFLHAWKIEFYHYGREKKMSLEARLKDDMKKFLEQI